MKKKNKENSELENDEDLFAFQDLTTLEAQMDSLKTKGFLRPYRAYSPPTDLVPRFLSSVSASVGSTVEKSSLKSVSLEDKSVKLRVMTALEKEFNHSVPNSMLHQMTNLHVLLKFYKSPISSNTPYEQLYLDSQDGSLPPNLVIQRDAIRFTGKGDHEMDRVTAWPRRNTYIHSIKNNKKIEGFKSAYSKYQEEDYN